MGSLKVLFIGGTGIISSACVRAAVEAGHDVSVLNRGRTASRPLPVGVRTYVADARDVGSMREAVGDIEFDVVADFMSFVPDHVRLHTDVWRHRVGQYLFISSASAYQTPPQRVPVVEDTPLDNPFWQYSRDKAACEAFLLEQQDEGGLPATIVRPSHTYDRTLVPFDGGWTVVERMKRGAPIVIHGDGTSLWTLTHHRDFAAAFIGLFGFEGALGEAYHITSDEFYTWDQIANLVASAADVEPRIVHVASEAIASVDPHWGASLLGDKAHSMVFDNSKIKRVVPAWAATTPFDVGAREIVAWYEADAGRRAVDPEVERTMDLLIGRFGT